MLRTTYLFVTIISNGYSLLLPWHQYLVESKVGICHVPLDLQFHSKCAVGVELSQHLVEVVDLVLAIPE